MRVFSDHSSSCRYLQPITEGVDRGHRSWGGGSHCINSQKWREVNSGAQFPFSFIFNSRPRPVEQCCPQLPVSQAVLDPFKLIGLNTINSGNKQANKQKHHHLTDIWRCCLSVCPETRSMTTWRPWPHQPAAPSLRQSPAYVRTSVASLCPLLLFTSPHLSSRYPPVRLLLDRLIELPGQGITPPPGRLFSIAFRRPWLLWVLVIVKWVLEDTNPCLSALNGRPQSHAWVCLLVISQGVSVDSTLWTTLFIHWLLYVSTLLSCLSTKLLLDLYLQLPIIWGRVSYQIHLLPWSASGNGGLWEVAKSRVSVSVEQYCFP